MFYKQRPYIYVGIGVVSLIVYRQFHSKIALISGFILIICGALVYLFRKSHQEQREKLQSHHDKLTKEIKKNNN